MSLQSSKLSKELAQGSKLVPIDPDISSVEAPETDVLDAFLMQEVTDAFIKSHQHSNHVTADEQDRR